MYKSMLQELCQKKSWNLPVYDAVKDGPDHRPLFTGTVTVNGATFASPVQCGSSKEAQNAAAQVAFSHYSFLPTAPPPPVPAVSRLRKHGTPVSTTNFNTEAAKSEKVEQKRQYGAPLVEIPISTEEGTPVSTTNFNTKAAKSEKVEQKKQYGAPLAEIPTSTKEGLLHTYKNRLQIYAQKRNLTLPTYSCEIVGPPHGRCYKSKVTVDGKSFETPNFFSTLKDAEHGAAKVAFEAMSLHLTQEDEVLYKSLLQEHAQRKGLRCPTYETERSGPPHMPIFVSTVEIGGKRYQGQEAKAKKMAEMNAAKAAYVCLTKCQETPSFNSSGDASSFNLQPDVTEKVKVEDDAARKSSISSKEKAGKIQDNNGKRLRNSTTSEDAHDREQGSSIARSLPQDPIVIVIPPAQPSVRMILVSPHTPDVVIPEGATILPSSDDKWVAMAMAGPEEGYKEHNN